MDPQTIDTLIRVFMASGVILTIVIYFIDFLVWLWTGKKSNIDDSTLMLILLPIAIILLIILLPFILLRLIIAKLKKESF